VIAASQLLLAVTLPGTGSFGLDPPVAAPSDDRRRDTDKPKRLAIRASAFLAKKGSVVEADAC
jgi:hypothetical protein